jgi:hypothetical protein
MDEDKFSALNFTLDFLYLPFFHSSLIVENKKFISTIRTVNILITRLHANTYFKLLEMLY